MPGVFAIDPPIEPMLAKLADGAAGGRLSLRAEVGRLSRDRVSRRRATCSSRAATCGRSIATFPSCTTRCLDAAAGRLRDRRRDRDRDAARPRLRRAAAAAAPGGVARGASSRRRRRRRSSPSTLLAVDGRRSARAAADASAARGSSGCSAASTPPIHLTPMTRDRAQSRPSGSTRFEGAGLDGVIAKPADGAYQPGKRAMIKVKHVAHRRLRGRRLPLAQERQGRARRARCCSGCTTTKRHAASRRRHLVVHDGGAQAARGRARAAARARARATIRGATGRMPAHGTTRMPGGQSRWSAGKDLSWEPLRIERVCEVKYDHMQGDRFRHAAIFLRWRPDKPPRRLPLRSARGHDRLTSSRRCSARGRDR